MGRKLGNLILFIAALQVAGGHWLALQSLAWAGMLINYSQTDSLVVAVEKTFSGDHPCKLCQAVKKGKSEENRQQNIHPVQKLEAVLVQSMKISNRTGSRAEISSYATNPTDRSFPPPTPPPLAGIPS